MSVVLPPYAIVPLIDGAPEPPGDIAGGLNDRFFGFAPK